MSRTGETLGSQQIFKRFLKKRWKDCVKLRIDKRVEISSLFISSLFYFKMCIIMDKYEESGENMSTNESSLGGDFL